MKVAIIGCGYVGLTTGVALAYLGHQVTGVEKDQGKLELLNQGKSPIHEQGLEKLINECASRLSFVADASLAVPHADVIVIAVGTPQKENGEADTYYVEEAAREVASALLSGRSYTLVIKSTVPIGSNRRVAYVIEKVLNEQGNNAQVYLASNPEFLREGLALRDTLYPDRIVVGAKDSRAVEELRLMYRHILEQTFEPPAFLPRPEGYMLPPLITTDPTSAEMIRNWCLWIVFAIFNVITRHIVASHRESRGG